MQSVLVAIPDLFVLAGNVHMTLKLADMMKDLGHYVKILYSDIRPFNDHYFSLDTIGEYYPLKVLGKEDFEEVAWEDYYVEVLARLGLYENIPQYDVFVSSYESLSYINEDTQLHEIFYVHWPDRPRAPTGSVWTNSQFTRQRIRKRWGIDATVVNPPIHIERYNPSRSFEERDIDIIGFGQLYPQKGFNRLTPLYEKGYKVVVIGAKVIGAKDELVVSEVVSNADFKEITDLLSRSKVFIHPKKNEHFGMAIIEAMASGCATICHRSGGPLSDIILADERYGMLFSTETELDEKVNRLLSDKELWKEYSRRAVIGASRYDYEKIKTLIAELREPLVSKLNYSVLDSALLKDLIERYSREGELVLTPFMSWGMIGIVSREMFRPSISLDIVRDYCDEAQERINRLRRSDGKDIQTIIRHADSRSMPLKSDSVNLIIGSPPYFQTERYKSTQGQLSDITDYNVFLSETEKVIRECRRVLKGNRHCLWIVGAIGGGYNFVGDSIKMFEKNDFILDDENETSKWTVEREGLSLRVVLPFRKL